jgi:hypothetical protein
VSRTKKTRTDDHTLDVLHVIRVAGLIDTDAIAERARLDQQSVIDILDVLAAGELVTRREGRMPGWRLSDSGKERHSELLTIDMSDTDRRHAVEALHEAFVPLNVSFKTVCTDWQLRDGAPNMHDDAAYDQAITERLHLIHDELAGPLTDAAGAVTPLTTYAPRFTAALDRLDAGDTDAFTRPLNESYHDVWMELHQDLILRLDLKRGDDDA